MMHTIVRAIPACCIVAAWLVLLVDQAYAGSYVVSACSPSTSEGAWTRIDTHPNNLVAGNLCGGPEFGPGDAGNEGGLYAEDALGSAADIPEGAHAGWVFTAPTGATITAIRYFRSLASYEGSDFVSGLFQADGSVLEQCKIPWPFPTGSSIICSKPNSRGPLLFDGLDTPSLLFGVRCHIVDDAPACDTGGREHYARGAMYSAQVTLSEDLLPTISDLGGRLWEGGTVFGTVPVTFSATDPSGIQQIGVHGDAGDALTTAAQTCDFTHLPPCEQVPAAAMSVDTTRVLDGPHAFTVTATDAAGNTQTSTSPGVVVDNNGPPPPTGLTAIAQNGSIKLTWRNPANAPAPITSAITQLCQATCMSPLAVNSTANATIPLPEAGQYTVRLWLLDSNGRGGPQNATQTSITIKQPGDDTPKPNPDTRTKITATIHGRRLRVSGPIATTGRVTVSWRSKRRDHTLGHGSRTITIHNRRLAMTFVLNHRARTGTTRIAIRKGRRLVGHALARRT